MGSSHVSLRDTRQILTLVGEVRELGCDVSLWHPHLLDGVCRLTGAQVGIGANMRNFVRGKEPEGLGVYRTGWPDAQTEKRWSDYVNSVDVQSTPEYAKLVGFPGRIVTRTRTQIYEDSLWYRSKTFNEFHRACGLDHYVFSIVRLGGLDGGKDLFNSLWIHRPLGARAFGRREWWIVRTVHASVAAMVGEALAAPGEPGVGALSPRQRDVLDALLEGDSEKQAAARLGISPTTVHEHVAALYRHFGVASRGELMARFVGRARPS